MAEGSGGPAFPVTFFDGEKEMNIGSVKISPAFEYKPFQLMLSQKIGISPNQISIYLVDRRKIPELPFTEYRHRIPITGKVNFGLICRQKDCGFLVVLKRSRKSRNRRERTNDGGKFSDFILDRNDFSAPLPQTKSMILLKRSQPSPFDDQISQSELAEFNDQLQKFRFQRDNHQLPMGKGDLNSPSFGSCRGLYLNPIPIPSLNMDMDSFPDIDNYLGAPTSSIMTTKNDGEILFCKDCLNAMECEGNTTLFHPCVRDAVITRFSTKLGPINRPIKHPL